MLSPEDDIEKIYRDFAKNYPLKTDDKGWDEFLQKMESTPVKNIPERPVNGSSIPGIINKYRYWLSSAAVVLILAGILIIKNKTEENRQPVSSVNKEVLSPGKQKQPGLPKSPNTQTTVAPAQNAPPLQQDINKSSADVNKKKEVQQNTLPQPGNKENSDGATIVKANKYQQNSIAAANHGSLTEKQQPVFNTPPFESNKAEPSAMPLNQDANTQQTKGGIALIPKPGDDLKASLQSSAIKSDGDKKNTGLTGDSAVSAGQNNNIANKAVAVQPITKISTKTRKYFYLGLATGPDISTVKLQTVYHTGINIGIIAGVHVWKNIDIESGLLLASKKYYSSGKYFKKQNIPPPDRDDLESVNTNGNFLEVPVTVRLSLTHKKRYNLFVRGGLSSYFTGSEKYDLSFHHPWGNERKHEESEELRNNLFSIVHLSAGYELNFNAHNKLRLEPYLKIPLSGIGGGALPVTSTGLYINFTHSFFK